MFIAWLVPSLLTLLDWHCPPALTRIKLAPSTTLSAAELLRTRTNGGHTQRSPDQGGVEGAIGAVKALRGPLIGECVGDSIKGQHKFCSIYLARKQTALRGNEDSINFEFPIGEKKGDGPIGREEASECRTFPAACR